MTQKKKILAALCGCLAIGILFWWLRQPDPSKSSGAAVNDLGMSSLSVSRGATFTVPSISAVRVTDADSSAAIAHSANAGTADGLGWHKAVAIRDTKWAIEQLSISSDPNDRLRGYALSLVCTKILLQPRDAFESSLEARKKTPEQRRDIAQMREDMQSRCGSSDNGNPYLPSSATRQGMWSARTAQVPLAVAFDTSLHGAAKSGLTVADADALSIVMKDESLRSAWIAKSLMDGLGQELSTTANFAGVSADEMTAALMTVLCRSGDDCGADSLYRPYLCFTSGFQFCSGTTIGAAIASNLPPENAVRFENTVRQLQVAFAAGDLDALGLRKREK